MIDEAKGLKTALGQNVPLERDVRLKNKFKT
jgi:hypothetical protein